MTLRNALARLAFYGTALAFLVAAYNGTAATAQINGSMCAITHATYWPPLIVECGSGVYVCPTAGGSYGAGAVLSLPAPCLDDRVFRSNFD